MGKRRQLIIISDDDDDDDGNGSGGHTDSFAAMLPKLPFSQVKSSLLVNDDPEIQPENCGPHEMESEKWEGPQLKMQLWVDKYRPNSLSDLVVHHKKVAQVREWLEARLRGEDKLCGKSYVLLLTGPTGVGKTMVVRILVDLLDAELCEWNTPVPTLWKEYLHHGSSGAPYISKLKEFEAFLESVKKYPILPLIPSQSQETDQSLDKKSLCCGKSKVLLLEDLPNVQERESLDQLCHCLHNFALSVKFPTVVVITDFLHNEENGQDISRVSAELQHALESGGAAKVMFNPITANAIKKVLAKISQAEKCCVSSQSLSFIAESCGGDLRHAIYCLQFLCLGKHFAQHTWDPGGVRLGLHKSKQRKVSANGSRNKNDQSTGSVLCSSHSNEQTAYIVCRDGVLSLFHALGKLLYNKRHDEDAKESGEGMNLLLKDHLQRHPLNMETPEIILLQAHTENFTFLSFLHENLLDFVNDEGIEDVAACMSYLSDVDCLLGVKYKVPNYSTCHGTSSFEEITPGLIAEATAGSIAARGVLFTNTHPERHRWQAIRAPALRQVERLLREKELDLQVKSWAATMDSLTIVAKSTQATEFEPYSKQIRSTCPNKPWMSYTWQELSEMDFGLDDALMDLTVASSQEQEVSLDSTMDINRSFDVKIPETYTDCDDEIEEW